jgi:hypothetical protein
MPRPFASLLLGAMAIGVTGCGIPTDLADWDMTWSVPTTGTSIGVNSLLPSGVSSAGNAFAVTVPTTTITRRLGDDCSACAAANGLTVPKPAFIGSGTSTAMLPSAVTSATLGANTLNVTLRHGYNFDPLRPSAMARGWLRLVVTSNGVVIGRDSLNGATTAFPSGSTLTRTLTLAGDVTRSGVVVTSTIDSPAGDAVLMQADASLSATAAFTNLTVTKATVSLSNQSITSDPTSLDLSDIDSDIRDRAQGGKITLTINNPFAATGALTVSFTGGAQPVQKSIQLSSGPSTQDISLSKAELRALLGYNISLRATGQVNGSSVSVMPGQTVTVSSRLQFTFTREAQP